jgi:hypothetical protein
MLIRCPRNKANGFKNSLICIYNCKFNVDCRIYEENYTKFQEEPIAEQYILKYGEPVFPIPSSIARKAERLSKKEKEMAILQRKADKAKKAREKKELKESKEREKKKRLEDREEKKLAKLNLKRVKGKFLTGQVTGQVTVQVKKRTRRTKAQMLAARTEPNNFFEG